MECLCLEFLVLVMSNAGRHYGLHPEVGIVVHDVLCMVLCLCFVGEGPCNNYCTYKSPYTIGIGFCLLLGIVGDRNHMLFD